MNFKEIFTITRGTKVILVITFTVAILAILFAFFYYRSINNSEDPRISKARKHLMHYDRGSGEVSAIGLFPYLDSAMVIFRSLPDYERSFETGLIYNNKSSALLLAAVYDSTLPESEKKMLLDLSMKYCDSSIVIYRTWMTDWGNLSRKQITDKIRLLMQKDDPVLQERNFEKIFSRRVDNTVTAQIETPRRLSVSLTNRGTIWRHMMKPDSALHCYEKALALWKENRTAESNLNVLMGGEPLKSSLIQSLFPPDRKQR